MFTGIIRGVASILAINDAPGLRTFTVSFPAGALTDLSVGASIALDGVCLTVTTFTDSTASFDVMAESLRLTTLGDLRLGSKVNFERAAKEGAEVGGHVLSGHVDCTAIIERVDQPANNYVIAFRLEPRWFNYVFSKGYIAVNGTSLTITNANRERCTFEVWFIPETLRMTTFGEKNVGDRVNIEIERQTQVIVDTVERFLDANLSSLMAKNFEKLSIVQNS